MKLKLLTSKAGTAYVIVRDGKQHLQKNWRRGRFYERVMLNYIYERHRYPEKVYVDVGANVGNHTLFFAAFCTNYKVVAVEPVRRSLELLRANVALNELSHRVIACETAVSNRQGRGAMERFGGPAYDGMQRLVKGDQVDVTRLDALLPGVVQDAHIGLIKIDVEYHEPLVIEGAMEIIKAHRPVLFIELVDQTNLKRVVAKLKTVDYFLGEKFNASATFEFLPGGRL